MGFSVRVWTETLRVLSRSGPTDDVHTVLCTEHTQLSGPYAAIQYR